VGGVRGERCFFENTLPSEVAARAKQIIPVKDAASLWM